MNTSSVQETNISIPGVAQFFCDHYCYLQDVYILMTTIISLEKDRKENRQRELNFISILYWGQSLLTRALIHLLPIIIKNCPHPQNYTQSHLFALVLMLSFPRYNNNNNENPLKSILHALLCLDKVCIMIDGWMDEQKLKRIRCCSMLVLLLYFLVNSHRQVP